MCGIFGLIRTGKSEFPQSKIQPIVNNLFRLSESRGKEAAGIAISSNNSIQVFKQPIPASQLIKKKEYQELFYNINKENESLNNVHPIAIIGHTRLVTNGSMELNINNQPIIKDGMVGVHNGIIVNDDELWENNSNIEKHYDIDTEVIVSLISKFLKETKSLEESIKKTFSLINGSASISILFNNSNNLLLATNTGSLYISFSKNKSICVFASEIFIIKNIIKKFLKNIFHFNEISQIKPNHGCIINISSLVTNTFSFNENKCLVDRNYSNKSTSKIVDLSHFNNTKSLQTKKKTTKRNNFISSYLDQFHQKESVIDSLKRCSRCILPESMPLIKFNDQGICNYCTSYNRIELKGENALKELVSKYKKNNEKPDCLVALSGGRDSSYGLYYIKEILGMNPVAYSYDWGMITDLGRRNQARMCGNLGVEHIIISADIKKKRENIRKNVLAWLQKPDLGTVPLFMAGDKQYFYYANQLMKKIDVNLILMCENILERTHFKHGFCNVKHNRSDKPPYFLGVGDKFKLATYYGKQFLKNKSYINSSILDTISGYFSYYVIPHNYLYLFQYVKWDETEINTKLISEFDWEIATDTKSTWRIGDGTASFYNYIYYTIAGFSENDTFRSNQIRENLISREEALSLTRLDNRPRFDSIQWYCDTIGIDFDETIKIINSIPSIY
ncbi:MAG: hypothetical protein SVZ03_09950 [Spirochaetota bacterium]|nr:hypothetical protein [Spirochaetota bacterium]